MIYKNYVSLAFLVHTHQAIIFPHLHIYYLKFYFGGIGAMKVAQTQMHSFSSPSRPGKVSENESIKILGCVGMAYFKIQLLDGQRISVPKYSELYTHSMVKKISLWKGRE